MIFKKFLSGLNKSRSYIFIVNCLVIVFLVNLLVNFVNFRLDLTQNKIHSLSPATKKILKELDDIVTFKLFLSEEIPEQLMPIKTNIVWFVENYEKSAAGKLQTKILDPTKDKPAEEEANRLGIPPIEFSSLKKDKFEVTRGYLAVVASYGDRNEIVSLQDLANLEYHLTSAIKKVTQEKLKVVGFTEGHQETDLQQIALTEKILAKSYQWETIKLDKENAKFNPQIDVLVVNAPTKEIEPEIKMVIDQYLQNGKGVLFLVDRYRVDNNLIPMRASHNLDDLLKHYGINFKEGLVLDRSAALAGFRTEQGGIIVPYPYWIKIIPSGLNKEQTPTASLQTLTLSWASSLELDNEATWLIKTTPRAWLQTTITDLSPDQKFNPPAEGEKEFILAAIQTRPLPSFFDKEPDKTQKEKLGIQEWKKENKDGVRLAVVGDGDFIKDNFVSDNEGNLQFFLNLVDFLAQEKDLIEIRSKPVISRPIPQLRDQAKQIIRIGNLFFPMLLVVVTYLFVRMRRNAHFSKKF